MDALFLLTPLLFPLLSFVLHLIKIAWNIPTYLTYESYIYISYIYTSFLLSSAITENKNGGGGGVGYHFETKERKWVYIWRWWCARDGEDAKVNEISRSLIDDDVLSVYKESHQVTQWDGNRKKKRKNCFVYFDGNSLNFFRISSSVNLRVWRLSMATRSSMVMAICFSPMGTMHRARCS